ncbi:MAG: Flp family type IVb pilin [Aestuariivirgaceae bacterium]
MRNFLSVWLKELERFAEDEDAATAIEYAMIASTVTLAIMYALSDIENSLRALYASVSGGFN